MLDPGVPARDFSEVVKRIVAARKDDAAVVARRELERLFAEAWRDGFDKGKRARDGL